MRTLFVAAGGGGDAVGILLARRLLDPEHDGEALIATCAWERLRVDPTPGPRPASGFRGLGALGGRPLEVLPTSETLPANRSMLPRLAAESAARLFLCDFEGGAEGLAGQLASIANALDATRIVVVDVGGDVVATGSEPSLLSPLADSLTLAAALRSGLRTSVAVVGPGTDAELAVSDVIRRLDSLGARRAGSVSAADAASLKDVLTWHPTEASALVAAAALGERGAVAMRRGGVPTPLTDRSAEVWIIARPLSEDFPLAVAVSRTRTLAEARAVMAELSVDEIAYEENKAERVTSAHPAKDEIARAIAQGASHITDRRLHECADPDPVAATLRRSPSGLWPI